MIIPVKCFTCGKVLADKYLYYLREVNKESGENIKYLTEINVEKTIEGKILDKLGLDKMCCRRHMLTHVDIF